MFCFSIEKWCDYQGLFFIAKFLGTFFAINCYLFLKKKNEGKERGGVEGDGREAPRKVLFSLAAL